jgi:protein-S-isoprenylcysteine O-methyltransferase Ste14
MDNELFVVAFSNLAIIGILPFVFFRRDGTFNLRWWLTGAPFFLSGASILCGRLGIATAWAPARSPAFGTVAIVLSVAAVGAIGWTVGSHRAPLALWHQDNDAPMAIVDWGPYRYVRHPFYASFLVAQTAALLAFPHIGTAIGLVYACAVLSITARREERRLLQSPFGDQYRAYMAKTGRLVPGIGRLAT